MDDGWIRIYRKSLDSSIFQNEKYWKVWCWVLMKASHTEHSFLFNGEDIMLKQGEFITGRKEALKELSTISEQSYRSAISYLKSTSRITIQSTNRFSIIQVQNWIKYQQTNQPVTNQLTNKQPASNQPVTTYNNDKNDKNDKNDEDVEKISNRLSLTRSQMAYYQREFKGLTLDDIKQEMAKCNSYMGMSSENYKNPGLFFKSWLTKAQKEKGNKQAEQNRMEASIGNLPELSPEAHLRARERLVEIRSRFGSRIPKATLTNSEMNIRRNELLQQAKEI